jgi:hypothetical protein
MKSRRILLFVGIVTLGNACVVDCEIQETPPAKYELQVIDEPEKLRFSLVLTSKDERDICIDGSSWPDEKGKTETGSYVYSLRTERGTMFPHEPTVYIDCFDSPECSTRVRHGESLRGFIAYSEFGDPNQIRAMHKRELRIDIIPSVCGSDKKETRKDAVPSKGDPSPASSPKSAITPQGKH